MICDQATHVPVAEINDELQDMIQEPHFNACGNLSVSEWVSVEATHNLFVEHIHPQLHFSTEQILCSVQMMDFITFISSKHLCSQLWRAKHILLVYSIQIMFSAHFENLS